MITMTVLTKMAVQDLDAAVSWYQRLLDRAPDAGPTKEMAGWQFNGGGLMQLVHDAERAGSSSVTFVEENLGDRVVDLKAKGIGIDTSINSDYANMVIVEDPDGNRIIFSEAKPAVAQI